MLTTLLREEHFPAILTLDKQHIVDLPLNFYHHSDDNLIAQCVSSGLSLGIFDGTSLVGYRLTFKPGLSKVNLGYFLDLSEQELRKVAQLYGTLLTPVLRNKGLGSMLMKESLNIISDKGFHTALVTVHPDNQYSLKMCQGCGFDVMKEISFYGNLPRILLKKDFQSHVTGDRTHIRREGLQPNPTGL